MNLPRTLFKQASLDFLQQIQKTLFSTILNIIVINSLPRDNYAYFGIAAGYFVFMQWLVLTPETVLIQQYKKIKKKEWSDFLASVTMFGWLRSFGVFLLSVFVASFVFYFKKDPILSLSIILYSIYQVLITSSGSFQFILKMNLKQKEVTFFTLLLNALKLLFSVSLLFYSNVVIYLLILIFFSFIEIIIWLTLLRKSYSFPFIFSLRKTLSLTKKYLISFSIWQQLSGVFTKAMYQVDTFFLSLVGIALASIGNYTISLQIANFSFIIPNLLQSSLAIWLSRIHSKEKTIYITGLYLKYSFFVSMLQLFFFILFGKWYILLYSRENVDLIYHLSLIIIIGTTIINFIRPLISLSNARLDIRKLLIRSHIPSTIFSFICYYFMAKSYGLFGAAYANILVYLFWGATLVLFIYRNKYSVSLNLKISSKEKDFLKNIFLSFKNKYGS